MPTTQTTYPLVSIVIPMLNEIEAIERCIASIQGQDYPQECIEILVVDGLSTDGSRERVRQLAQVHHNIRLLDNPAKRTPFSLNIGAKNSAARSSSYWAHIRASKRISYDSIFSTCSP